MTVYQDLKVTIEHPLTRMERCLEQWLVETGQDMGDIYKRRAAALLARYFEHEDDCTDHLVLSFLRHYSGLGHVDFDDIHDVRAKLADVLRHARIQPAVVGKPDAFLLAAVPMMVAFVLVAVASVLWNTAIKPQPEGVISRYQADLLRADIGRIAAQTLEKCTLAPATPRLWNVLIKQPHGLKSYFDLPAVSFETASAGLAVLLHEAQHKPQSFCARMRVYIDAP